MLVTPLSLLQLLVTPLSLLLVMSTLLLPPPWLLTSMLMLCQLQVLH